MVCVKRCRLISCPSSVSVVGALVHAVLVTVKSYWLNYWLVELPDVQILVFEALVFVKKLGWLVGMCQERLTSTKYSTRRTSSADETWSSPTRGSFQGGTLGDAIPIGEKLSECMGTTFSLLKCSRTHYGRHCEPFSGQKCTGFQDFA